MERRTFLGNILAGGLVTGTESISSTDVRYQLPPGREASQATAYSPDRERSQTISFSKNGTAISFTIPEIKVYSIVAVS